MATPLEGRAEVIKFHNAIKRDLWIFAPQGSIVKRIFNSLFVRTMVPSQFARHLTVCGERPSFEVQLVLTRHALDISMRKDTIFVEAFRRCGQILTEYALYLLGHHDFLATLIGDGHNLLAYYLWQEEESCLNGGLWTMELTAQMDEVAFKTCVSLIRTKQTHPNILAKGRQMIAWLCHILPNTPNSDRIFLDSTPVDLTTLLRIRRLHERTMMSRFPLDDISSPSAPMTVMLSAHHQPVYRHSELIIERNASRGVGSLLGKRGGVVKILGHDGYTLKLFEGKKKILSPNRYNGLLELLSMTDEEGRVFADRRLEHQYVHRVKNVQESIYLVDKPFQEIDIEQATSKQLQLLYVQRLSALLNNFTGSPPFFPISCRTTTTTTTTTSSTSSSDASSTSSSHIPSSSSSTASSPSASVSASTYSSSSHSSNTRAELSQKSLPPVHTYSYERDQLDAQSFLEDILLYTYTEFLNNGYKPCLINCGTEESLSTDDENGGASGKEPLYGSEHPIYER